MSPRALQSCDVHADRKAPIYGNDGGGRLCTGEMPARSPSRSPAQP